MLYSTRFIPMACDWSLAARSGVSHSQKYVCSSTKAKEDGKGETAQDSSPGHMHLLPIKVSLAGLHRISPEGSIHHLKSMKSFYYVPNDVSCLQVQRCNILPLVPKVSNQHYFGIPSIQFLSCSTLFVYLI